MSENAVPAHQTHAHDGFADKVGLSGPADCVVNTEPPPPLPVPGGAVAPGISHGITPDLQPSLSDTPPADDAPDTTTAAGTSETTAAVAPVPVGDAGVTVTALPSTGSGDAASRIGTAAAFVLLSLLRVGLVLALRLSAARR